MHATCLAFDLGAESGRAIAGTLRDGRLELAELRRFPNQPIDDAGALRWNIRALWSEMLAAIDAAPRELASIGVDAWGVDYALLDREGELIENPYHYRDRRTEGVLESILARVPRERIYEITGIQFLPINTLVQLYAATRATPEIVDRAESLLTIPDLLNFWLTGNRAAEYTVASTTQLLDARRRDWAFDLIGELRLPARLFQPIVEPGRKMGTHAGVPVIAPACHDTASAVAAIAMSPPSAFLSSGTWSLLGAEIAAPVITPLARDFNFTNEGGVGGTIRLLKNIAGLWLLQSCRRSWLDCSYDELIGVASREPALVSIVDPDHPSFLSPPDMTEAIARFCVATGQPVPASPPAMTRAILESLALRYRATIESLEQVTARRFDEIQIVGGGSRNRLLNQLTADATGRRVVAGPVEATALGNIAMQMVAIGAIGSLEGAREIIAASFPVATFEPEPHERWNAAYARFHQFDEAGVEASS
jgi:rhamnulokinase